MTRLDTRKINKTMKTQNEQILKHLQKGKSLTPIKALDKFGCFRLSGRICELRERGHDINTEMIKLKSGKRIAKYYL